MKNMPVLGWCQVRMCWHDHELTLKKPDKKQLSALHFDRSVRSLLEGSWEQATSEFTANYCVWLARTEMSLSIHTFN